MLWQAGQGRQLQSLRHFTGYNKSRNFTGKGGLRRDISLKSAKQRR
jgi:hypothetical protein